MSGRARTTRSTTSRSATSPTVCSAPRRPPSALRVEAPRLPTSSMRVDAKPSTPPGRTRTAHSRSYAAAFASSSTQWTPGSRRTRRSSSTRAARAPRIQILPSSRHVTVTLDDVVVADTERPVFLHETGLIRRTYFNKLDIRMDLLTPTDRTTRCPYKGTARVLDSHHTELNSTPTSRGAIRHRSVSPRRSWDWSPSSTNGSTSRLMANPATTGVASRQLATLITSLTP